MSNMEHHLAEVAHALSQMDVAELEALERVVQTVKVQGGTLYTFGNGGSHATAAHLVNDLVKIVGVRAVCLGEQVSLMLAMGNDLAWEDMYAGMLKMVLRTEDGLIGISCSGESENVVRALVVGIVRKLPTAALTGRSVESRVNKLGLDALVHTPGVLDIRVQEDVHLAVCHAVTRMYG